MKIRAHIIFEGLVQGVFFRPSSNLKNWSTLALFGVPGHFDLISVGDPARRPWAIGTLSLIATGLVGLYFGRHRRNTTVAERTFAGFAAGTLLAYCAYFLLVGPTYQQWKFASYFTLPMTAVVLAGGLRLLASCPAADRVMATARARRLAAWLVAAVAGAFVGGNVLVHAFIDPPLQRWEAGLRTLRTSMEGRLFTSWTCRSTGAGRPCSPPTTSARRRCTW